jgi:hypothetical protein
VLRLQAAAGRFGALEDIEAEIARRYAELRAAPTVELTQAGSDGAPATLRAQATPDGGLVLNLGGTASPLPPAPPAAENASPLPPAPPAAETEEPAATEEV